MGILFGIPAASIREAAAAFTGVEHRLEHVATVDGVRFINDSQGTQPDAVIAALEAFPAPIVLIAGGRDKGVDLSALGPVVAARASAAVLIGESAPDLERRFRDAGLSRTERVETLDEAVGRADALAREALTASSGAAPATVLLSPAAASFDMFPDYAARRPRLQGRGGRPRRRTSPESTMNLAPPSRVSVDRSPTPRHASASSPRRRAGARTGRRPRT